MEVAGRSRGGRGLRMHRIWITDNGLRNSQVAIPDRPASTVLPLADPAMHHWQVHHWKMPRGGSFLLVGLGQQGSSWDTARLAAA